MTLAFPSLGFGAASLGNLFDPMTDGAAHTLLDRAWDAGIRYFDTAPYYGFGLSERRLGDALRERVGATISTKVGRLLAPVDRAAVMRHGFASPLPFEPRYDYGYDGIMRSYEDSLQRLGLARVDALLVHDIGAATHGDNADSHWRALFDGGYRALDDLRSSGAVKGIGLGVNEIDACLLAMRHGHFDAFLLAGRYSLLEQAPLDELFPACEAAGVRVVVGGVFNSGILAKGTSAGGPLRYNYEPAPNAVVARVRQIERVCDSYGVPLAAAALQFPGHHQVVTSTLSGIANLDQLDATLDWFKLPIPAGLWSDLRAEGLIRPDAPTG